MLRRANGVLLDVALAARENSVGRLADHLLDEQAQVAAGAVVRGRDVPHAIRKDLRDQTLTATALRDMPEKELAARLGSAETQPARQDTTYCGRSRDFSFDKRQIATAFGGN